MSRSRVVGFTQPPPFPLSTSHSSARTRPAQTTYPQTPPPSYPSNTLTSSPRTPYTSNTPCTPQTSLVVYRESSASASYEAIGTLLSSPNASDSDHSDDLVTPLSRSPPMGRVRDPHVPRRIIRSVAGEVEGEMADDESGILAFDTPSPPRQSRGRVVDFPQPNLSPGYTQRPQPRPVQRPHIIIPHTHLTPPSSAYTIPRLPSSGTPISPHLAAAPLTPPRTPFSATSRDSKSSKSIQGYEVMKEKKALFRGGEEELISPFRGQRQESGPRRGVAGRASGVDFWKRFSVSVKLDQVARGGKGDSEWLNEAQNKRRRIKWIILAVIVLVSLISGGIGAFVVLRQSNNPAVETRVTSS